jgi:hypothetical protein
MQFFDTILPGEKNVLTFNFSAGLTNGNQISGIPTVVVTTYSGSDHSPSAILNGAAQVDSTGTLVLQPVAPNVNLNQYLVVVTCATNQADVTLILQGVLPVSSQ